MATFSELTENYVEWLKHGGVRFMADCEIQDLRHNKEGRGVIALQDINEGDVICEIPRAMVLSFDTSTLLQDLPHIRDELLHLNQWEVLIIVLLYEIKVKDVKSKWTGYLKVLPILDRENYQFDQLMFWSDDELKELSPSLITQRIGKDLAIGMYKKLFPKIVLDKMGIDKLHDTTLQDYLEVASLIMSYSFDVEKLNSRGFVDGEESDDEEDQEVQEESYQEDDDNEEGQADDIITDDEYPDSVEKDSFLKAMIPLADTLNADTKLHNASLEYQADKLIIRAITSIKAGDQIYNTYSDHPNSEILRRYGYVESLGSKHDFGEIPLSIIKQFFTSKDISPEFFDQVLEILKQVIDSEEDDDIADVVLDSYDVFATGEVIMELIILLQCLTILSSINSINSMESLSNDSKFQLVRRIYRKCFQLIEKRKLTLQMVANFKSIITLRMDQYPKFAADDFTQDLQFSRKNMAKVVLQSEYRCLKNCMDDDNAFKFNDSKYEFIDDDRLVRNIIKRKFDLPIIDDVSKKSKR